jgi:GntR family transcriptional regulator
MVPRRKAYQSDHSDGTIRSHASAVGLTEPLYSIIASRAERRIRSGAWAPGTRLPPERELCDLLDVSRATLRQALAELEQRGLISRHQGRGTFVNRQRVDTAGSEHFTISAALKARGSTLTTRVISLGIVVAGRSVADDLGVLPGDPVVHLERVRSLNSEPLLLETTDLPASLFPGLETADLGRRSLYDVMREDHGRTVQAATESLEPVIVTGPEATLLGVPRHVPAMLIRRSSTDQAGTRVERSHLLLRGDRCRLLLERRVREAWPGAPDPDGVGMGPRSLDRIAASLLVDA